MYIIMVIFTMIMNTLKPHSMKLGLNQPRGLSAHFDSRSDLHAISNTCLCLDLSKEKQDFSAICSTNPPQNYSYLHDINNLWLCLDFPKKIIKNLFPFL